MTEGRAAQAPREYTFLFEVSHPSESSSSYWLLGWLWNGPPGTPKPTIVCSFASSLPPSHPSLSSSPPPVLLEEGVQFAFDVDKGVVSHVVRLARLPAFLPLFGGNLGWRRRRRRSERRGGGGGMGRRCQYLPYLFMGFLLGETKEYREIMNEAMVDATRG